MAAAAGIVITASDLNRIKQTLLPEAERSLDGGVSLAQSKEVAMSLHQKSQARAKTWTNTLEGSRRKKAEERRRKLELQEFERQKVDAEEAKIQLDQRKATIERANKLLHEESDRMKSFHSKMMLCDVLAEREAQIRLKDELGKLDAVREDRFLEMDKQNYRKMLDREMKEKELKEQTIAKVAKVQAEQLAVYKEKRFKEVEDQMLEGELLRRKAIEDLESDRKAERKRRTMALQAVQETEKANEYLKQIKAEDMLRMQREEEKIEEYAMRKEKMLELRKKKEEEVFQAKQAARMKIIDDQAKRLADMQHNAEERIDRQVKEKEESDEKKRLAKEAQMKRWGDEIQASRRQQIERKQADRARERAQDAETAEFLQQWCKVLDKQDQDELDLKKDAARTLSDEHKRQCELMRKKTHEDRKGEAEIAKHARKAMEADTLEFHAYAEKVIREYADDGKTVIPLIKELRDFRKRVLE
mmetsp:Transcript_44204/g.104651  ORF Transcript_44204/g.104651 Transcript_44204/m.104651 type:complete len:473 (-) Transcript_44204:110-1528(-)